GFKKYNKILAILSLLLIITAYGLAEMSRRKVEIKPLSAEVVADPTNASYDALVHGKALFTANCVVCHGENGAMEAVGAKNLQTSELSDTEIKNVILNGKNSMPPYKKVLNKDEVTALIQYVKAFRK
ncbi:MAG: cytochrome c, partial [Bacteroidota bacterium]